MLSKLTTAAAVVFAYIARCMSFVSVRDTTLWVFIGWRRNDSRQIFADNAKYLFLAADTHPDLRAVWIAEDRTLARMLRGHGYQSYSRSSLAGIYYALRAGTTCIDANFHRSNWQWSGGSTVLQLWHGKGFKQTGYVGTHKSAHRRFLFPELYTPYDYTVATSAYTAAMMAETMRVPNERVLVTGLPRDDVLFRNIPGSDIDAHPELKTFFNTHTGKTVLYAPTFRRWDDNPIDHLDLARLEKYLERTDTHLIVSLHPKYHSKKLDLDMYPNIHFIASGYDLQPFVSHFDAVVTDYSNIFLEFLLLDKHTVFFTYDIDRYRAESGLYDDYDTLTPGPHVTDTDELIAALGEKNEWQNARAAARSTLFAHRDGGASERIIDALTDHRSLGAVT